MNNRINKTTVNGVMVSGEVVPGEVVPVNPAAPVKAFRGNVDMSKFDDRVDPDSISGSCIPNNYVKAMPIKKTNEEIDRQDRYNQMMGRSRINGMGYVFV